MVRRNSLQHHTWSQGDHLQCHGWSGGPSILLWMVWGGSVWGDHLQNDTPSLYQANCKYKSCHVLTHTRLPLAVPSFALKQRERLSVKVIRGNSEQWVILKISPLLQRCKQLHSSIATQVGLVRSFYHSHSCQCR